MHKYGLLIISLLLIITTRHHNGFLTHIPDLTIPLLLLNGIYQYKNNALAIIAISVIVDNYVIIYEGVSANCITPSYTILLLSYYLSFYLAKYINKNFITNSMIVLSIVFGQWLIATVSYYVFIDKPWAEFISYANKWVWQETYPTLIVVFGYFIITTATTLLRKKYAN